jgi:PPR repeat
MRAFAVCRRPFRHAVGSYLGQAHIKFRCRAFANDSAIEHLASGAATTSWLYDDPSIVFGPQGEVANSKLVKLVHEERYGAADRLRLQLQENGVPIQRHPVYRKAALAALQWEDLHLDLFSVWFSLIPYINESKSTPGLDPVRDIRNSILRSGSPATRRSLVKRFALMCASKGYFHPIYNEVVNLVARFATPTEGAAFLLHYEEAVRQYHRDIHPECIKITGRRYRIAAIEVCAQAGWLDQALEILQLERDFALPNQTYGLLVQALHNEGRLGDIAIVKDLRSYDDFMQGRFDLSSRSQTSTSPIPSVYDTQSSPVSKSTKLPSPSWKPILVSRRNVAAQLRAVRRILSSAIPPSQTELIAFLRNATRAGVTPRTLSLLRRKALSQGGRHATTWLHTELRFYASEKNYSHVISLFDSFPPPSILNPVFEHTLQRILRATNLDVSTLSTCPLVPSPKISKHDYWIIHKAIITLAVNLPWPLATIQTVYTAYLSSTTPLKGSSRVFATFVWAFAHCGSLEEAARVPHDMQIKGLVPNARLDIMLAWAYARAGDVDKAMRLLTKIEGGIGENGRSRLVMPQLVVYGRVIEGFVQAGLFVQAQEVEKRMRRTVSYSRGLNRHLDEVLDTLSSRSVCCSVLLVDELI